MGNMKDLVGMIPGASNNERCRDRRWRFKHIEAIIHSMTPIERSKPSVIDVKRKNRIIRVLELK
jgi:signal recognition particle subunit SRP54